MTDTAAHQARLAAVLATISPPDGVTVRVFSQDDFPPIQRLSQKEGWTTPTDRPEEALRAWQHSWPALVAVDEGGAVVGFLRAITDTEVTTYICEILVSPAFRGSRLGTTLLDICRRLLPRTRLDLLSTEDAEAFYRRIGCTDFPGFRWKALAFEPTG